MWMQTLPTIAQANILGFLSAEHRMFHANDLELLAMNLLSGVTGMQPDVLVARAAQELLSKVGYSNELTEVKDLMKRYPIPSWLLEYNGKHSPLLPWMPASLCSEISSAHQTCRPSGNLEAIVDNNKYHETDRTPTQGPPVDEEKSSAGKETRQDGEDEVLIGLGTPPHLSERRKRISEEQVLSTPSLTGLLDDGTVLDVSNNMNLNGKDLEHTKVGSSVYALAESLREAWLERQPTSEDLQSFCNLPDTITFFTCLKPWEMEDETVLNMIKVCLKKDSGFAWSAQVLTYCLLPKLLNLEQPASRLLVAAAIEAAKAHPRAGVDALLIPLVLCEKGLNKAQCDVFNRVLKECLPDNHILSLCGKMFLSTRRQHFGFGNTLFVPDGCLSRSVVWSEPTWAVLQTILSRSIILDEELLEALVNVCGEEVQRFAKSLKFSNLLLCLLSNFTSHLKPYKTVLQKIAQQTETFMTKSLTAKSSAL